jgi:hypothetical protein
MLHASPLIGAAALSVALYATPAQAFGFKTCFFCSPFEAKTLETALHVAEVTAPPGEETPIFATLTTTLGPVANAPVTFYLLEGDETIGRINAWTDTRGVAMATWEVPARKGAQLRIDAEYLGDKEHAAAEASEPLVLGTQHAGHLTRTGGAIVGLADIELLIGSTSTLTAYIDAETDPVGGFVHFSMNGTPIGHTKVQPGGVALLSYTPASEDFDGFAEGSTSYTSITDLDGASLIHPIDTFEGALVALYEPVDSPVEPGAAVSSAHVLDASLDACVMLGLARCSVSDAPPSSLNISGEIEVSQSTGKVKVLEAPVLAMTTQHPEDLAPLDTCEPVPGNPDWCTRSCQKAEYVEYSTNGWSSVRKPDFAEPDAVCATNGALPLSLSEAAEQEARDLCHVAAASEGRGTWDHTTEMSHPSRAAVLYTFDYPQGTTFTGGFSASYDVEHLLEETTEDYTVHIRCIP